MTNYSLGLSKSFELQRHTEGVRILHNNKIYQALQIDVVSNSAQKSSVLRSGYSY